MRRLLLTSALFRIVPLAFLPGCLVSFNDYPLGDVGGSGGTRAQMPEAGKGGAAVSNTGGDSGGSRPGGGGAGPSGGFGFGMGGRIEPNTSGAAGTEPAPGMIDDFEDGNQTILSQQGRSGVWYIANDGKGMQTPMADGALLPTELAPARAGSRHGVHTLGGPFADWGALIGTALASKGDAAVPYDVSPFNGIRLWVRSGAAAAVSNVRLNLTTPGTTTGGCDVCNDHFGADIPLTSQWQRVEVPWSKLAQTGYGKPLLGAPDLKNVIQMQFFFPNKVSFDLWLDDIELY